MFSLLMIMKSFVLFKGNISDALRNLVQFQHKNVKNIHGRVLLLVKLQALSLQIY